MDVAYDMLLQLEIEILLGLGVLLLVVCEYSVGVYANLVYSLLP